MKSTPWNTANDEQRDEDIGIEVPGQEEEVNDVPEVEHKDRGRHGST